MKKVFNALNKAYHGLRLLFDPAIEGNPYWPEKSQGYKSFKTNKSNLTCFSRRYVA